MTGWLLALVPQYGLWLLFFVTLFSCLALPLPASIMMLTAGGFAAAGDFELWQALLAALAGAAAGDQIGYWAGRGAGKHIAARRKEYPAQDTLISKAEQMMAKGGFVSIFLTRWLFSAVGPYVNVTAGSLKFTWATFTIAGIAGELVWSGLYVGLGYGFAGNLDAASDLLGSILGFVGAAAAVIILGYVLFKLLKSER